MELIRVVLVLFENRKGGGLMFGSGEGGAMFFKKVRIKLKRERTSVYFGISRYELKTLRDFKLGEMRIMWHLFNSIQERYKFNQSTQSKRKIPR